jgi:hypothetical protein
VRAPAGSAHMGSMAKNTETADARVAAVLEHNPMLKFVGEGTIADILDAAAATEALDVEHNAPSTGSIPVYIPVLTGCAA